MVTRKYVAGILSRHLWLQWWHADYCTWPIVIPIAIPYDVFTHRYIYIFIHIQIIYWQYSFMYRLLTIVQCLFSKHSHVAFRLERHRFPGGVRDAARERRSSSDLEMGEKVAIGRGYTMRQPKIKVRLGIMSSSCEFTDEFSLVKSRNPCFYG